MTGNLYRSDVCTEEPVKYVSTSASTSVLSAGYELRQSKSAFHRHSQIGCKCSPRSRVRIYEATFCMCGLNMLLLDTLCIKHALEYTGWPKNGTIFVRLNFIKY